MVPMGRYFHAPEWVSSKSPVHRAESAYQNDSAFWDLFPHITADANVSAACTALITSPDWGNKYSIATNIILGPFLQRFANEFPGWPEQELWLIFQEAILAVQQQQQPTADNRYFRSGVTGSDTIDTEECHHDDAGCFCYLEVTMDAGIPGFPQDYKSGKERKAALAFMHNLVVRLVTLLVSCDAANQTLMPADMWLLWEAVNRVDPDRNGGEGSDDEEELDDDVRLHYLNIDSLLSRFLRGLYEPDDSDESGDGQPVTRNMDQGAVDLLGLCGMLCKRALALAVCRYSRGFLFAKKQPIQYMGLTGLLRDARKFGSVDTSNYLKQNP
jgi:hypothetical protein